MGVISSLGNDVASNLDSLLNQQNGLKRIKYVDGLRKPFIGGEVKLDQQQLIALTGLNYNGKIHRTTLLGLKAAQEAWSKHRPDPSIRTAVLYGTTIGGINVSEKDLFVDVELPGRGYYKDLHDETYGADLISRQLGIHGYRATLSTACSTAANAILVGARMIRAGLIDRALVGGSEALTNYTLNGFDSLNLYDPEPNRPFDRDRAGLNLGEGGAFLENEKSNHRTGNQVFGELIGWGNACDGYHQTASSPEGTGSELAFLEALEIAGITPNDIDYVNAHGTGTPNNDLSESTVLKKVFGEVPAFSSTKSYTGHTLAAAGGIEAIFSLLSINHRVIFPNLQFKHPIPETGLVPVVEVVKNTDIQIVLSSSFGFGGNCTQLIFKKWQ
jgi:3-oxoacyl-[acyl-carrier-protein] synthase-1